MALNYSIMKRFLWYASYFFVTDGILTSFTWDTWEVVAGTPGRRVEATSWCRCRGLACCPGKSLGYSPF
jgi:hypothetical protein